MAKFLFKLPGVPALFKALFQVNHPSLERELFGLKFKNPVGIAAGFDKDANMIDELDAMGFGFVEIGTITPAGQRGNDKPRLFRLKKNEAIINRMGFNNQGVRKAVERLKKRKSSVIVGGNIGKNKITANEIAVRDYLECYDNLYEHVDYFTLNVSSPNTPNLRELQEKEPLTRLLKTICEHNKTQTKPRPILLKIAPDLTKEQLDDIIEIVESVGVDGIIATNTTVSRESCAETDWKRINKIGAGGLSGKPVRKRSTEVIKYISEKSDGKIPIIGVGGIFSAEDAKEKIAAGASLVQVYTGFVYEGPGLVKSINKALRRK